MESAVEVSLLIDGKVFRVKKDSLVEHSDYFRAMFSGSYIETERNEIKIDVVDAESMQIILQYMRIGLIDLTEYTLPIVYNLALAANFLQMTELIKQIEYTLEIQLSISNWMETMCIAENSNFPKLEKMCAAYGLYSFKLMDPKDITSIHKLFWYLSHPHLNVLDEVDVFKFGYEWISHKETGADALLIVLSCLDLKRLTLDNLLEIKTLIVFYDTSLAAKVVDCIFEVVTGGNEISVEYITENKDTLVEMFTERVFNEVLNLVKYSKGRQLQLVPVVPIWSMKGSKPEYVPHCMYKFSEERGLEKWIEVAEKELWGWSVTSWGPWRLVVVGGEHGRGTGNFMKDVRVYDTLTQEWIHHGVQLPIRRHAGVAVEGDLLYIVGGVGGFRVTQETAIVYNLEERTHRSIANLSEPMQSPALCAHKKQIYAAGHSNISRYEKTAESDHWKRVVGTDIRMSTMTSFKDKIYCMQHYFSHLYAFNPDVDQSLVIFTKFSNPPAAVCNFGKRLIFFTRNVCSASDMLNTVEEYKGTHRDESPRIIMSLHSASMKLNEVAGSCTLIMGPPPLSREVSHYHKRYLDGYLDY